LLRMKSMEPPPIISFEKYRQLQSANNYIGNFKTNNVSKYSAIKATT
jgi:hypothetical protein